MRGPVGTWNNVWGDGKPKGLVEEEHHEAARSCFGGAVLNPEKPMHLQCLQIPVLMSTYGYFSTLYPGTKVPLVPYRGYCDYLPVLTVL